MKLYLLGLFTPVIAGICGFILLKIKELTIDKILFRIKLEKAIQEFIKEDNKIGLKRFHRMKWISKRRMLRLGFSKHDIKELDKLNQLWEGLKEE